MNLVCQARKKLLGISPEEVRVNRRGFRCANDSAAAHLEEIGLTFLLGYHAALEEHSLSALSNRLEQSSPLETRGFAYEGAAMALMLLDRVGPRRESFSAFLRGPGARHAYMLHVGAGWAFARIPWVRNRLSATLENLDPIFRWLAVDGYGFHEGYFHWPTAVRRQMVPRTIRGYAARAFDQGLGRSLWFVEGTDPEQIASTISEFPAGRQPDLWAGVGLACAYAGGVGPVEVARLVELAEDHKSVAAQGAAFAAEARARAGNLVRHCDVVCLAFCGVSAQEAASIARERRINLPLCEDVPAYELWRRRIQQHFSRASGGACS
jgi:enediyne biosynthesis protein E3